MLFVLSLIIFLLFMRKPIHSEIDLVEQQIKIRTPQDEYFHFLTDDSVAHAFATILPYDVPTIESVFTPYNDSILKFKHAHDRIRPWDIKDIDRLDSKTAITPAYPAGHACQAWILYRHYSKLHPELEPELYAMAWRCEQVRVLAGLHFPSDGSYSRYLVFNDMLTTKKDSRA